MSASFRLNRNGVLLALISAAFAGEASAAAARVDFASGNVTVSGSDGRERPLSRGTELDSGDTVRTAEGRAQLRFTDGAYVSLQPNTEFSIKDYNFEGRTDGSERGFFALAKGAMRTVTGLVGRTNRNRYQITTPTATIGIRGTGGVIQILNDGSTLVVGTSGIWSLTNPSGSLDIPAGVSGRAPSTPDSPPQQTSQAPQSGPAPIPPQNLFTQGDQRDPSGVPVGISTFKPLVSGGGYSAAIAYGVGRSPAIDGGEGGAFTSSTAIFNSAGQLTALTDSGFGATFKLEPGGSHGLRADGTADFGSDGILAWGRWVGPVSATAFEGLTTTYGPNDGFHYVIGMPTPVMPTTGTANYSLLGATSPTYVGGGLIGPGKVTSGELNVAFGTGSYTVDLVNLGVAMPDASYRVDGSTRVFSGGSQFSLSTTVGGTGGNACSSTCSAAVSGFFAGASAERAGISYQINDLQKNVIGAAAFQKK